MRIIKATIPMLESRTLVIGFQAENQRTQVRIDCTAILTEYPHASPTLAIKPPVGAVYPVVVSREENEVVWNVSNADLQNEGDGELQLTFTKDGVVAKTVIGKLRISRSLLVTGEQPDVIQTWYDAATEKLADVDEAIFALEQIDAVAEGLPEGTSPTVQVVDYDDHKRFEFGVPKGGKGDTYELTQEDREEIAEIAEENFTTEVKGYRDDALAAKNRSEEILTAVSGSTEQAASSAAEAGRQAQAAALSAQAALSSATAADGSARTASEKASEANASAQNASGSASTATQKASAAAQSATDAAQSATNAHASELAAKDSETNAKASETNAASSASSALASKNAAAVSATNANTSETNAAGSASLASEKATLATNKANEASQSATNAANSASAAAGSEANAAQSAQAAQDVLDSIPEDYTALSGEVTDLKSAIQGDISIIGIASAQYYQDAGTQHESSKDQVLINVKSGNTILITITESVENALSGNASLQYYAYYADGTSDRIGFGKSKQLTHTLSKDLIKIGIFYSSVVPVLACEVTITVKVLNTDTFYGDFNSLKSEVGVTQSELNSIKLFLLPLGEIIQQSYVETTGVITQYNNWSRTDYIDISALSTLMPVSSYVSKYNCFYDANKTFISSFYVRTSETSVAVPENAKYVIFSSTNAGMADLSVKYIKKTEQQFDKNALIKNTFASVYCETDIDAKLVEYGEIVSTSGLSDNFLFFTDPHPFYGRVPGDGQWLDSIFARMPLVQKAYNSTATSFCLCGGDWLSDQDTPAQACAKLGYVSGLMKNLFDKHYMIAGNHDTNYQGTAQLSDSAFVNAMFNDIGKAYYTFKTHVARFYIFDTGLDWSHTMSAYRWEQIAWFANSLIENDDGHNVIGLHIVTNQYEEDFDTSPVFHEFAQNITALAQAYNSKTTITLNSITYDFTNKTGIVEFAIAGHSHYDKLTSLNSIPIMITDWLRDGDTATFDLVQADYTNHVVKTVRIGSGSNRTMNMASAG